MENQTANARKIGKFVYTAVGCGYLPMFWSKLPCVIMVQGAKKDLCRILVISQAPTTGQGVEICTLHGPSSWAENIICMSASLPRKLGSLKICGPFCSHSNQEDI